MGGGLMQLVAYGAQDIYLTGNPQITFFKVVYRRHTNFSMEAIEQTFNGSADFGRKVTCTISRNGDLIHRVYLQVTLPEVSAKEMATNASSTTDPVLFRWVNWIGHKLVESVEVEIGGQRIDKHYGEWLHIWNELTQTAGHKVGYASMVGNVPRLTQPIASSATNTGENNQKQVNDNAKMPQTTLYIPLQFWFCRNPGLALPLIALQYHEVKININFADAEDCFWLVKSTSSFAVQSISCCKPKFVSASLYVDYIYLDTDERRRFAQVSHEYLIEQLQFTGAESANSVSNKIKLNFNHPVKELVWTVQPDDNVDKEKCKAVGGPQWFNYTDSLDVTYLSGTPGDGILGEGLVGPQAPNNGLPYNVYGITHGLGATHTVGQFIGQKETAGTVAVSGGGPAGNTDISGTATATTSMNAPNFQVGNTSDWYNYFINQTGVITNAPVSDSVPVNDRGQNPVVAAKLQLNGHDRFSQRFGRYFNFVQPYQHHTNIPAMGINVYSFGLKPEEHQPSGTCNMSRIDNATLQLSLTSLAVKSGRACKVRVYAVNYNVLRIMSGMGGLAYSN